MNYIIEQCTPEWHALRCGKVTASRISDVTASGRNGAPSKMRATYMGELIAERLSGFQGECFLSEPMRWGKECEADARAAYAFYSSSSVEQVGFIDHPSVAMSGCSPDGLVGCDGLLEIKCPNTSTHIATLLGSSTAGEYFTQMQWQMACTGRQWCDFVSFDPRLPEHMRIKVIRVPRNNVTVSDLQQIVGVFQRELEAKLDALNEAYPCPTAVAA